ncbi:MAG TPA: AGE family epimerase/isomerase [Caulobacterales bacterium]|nr:AGE family epimerase/isomerase [Caulobacterales bacterium]
MTTHDDHLAFAAECEAELDAILHWWSTKAVDLERGGFYGEVDERDRPQPLANKGAILHARLLWFFSVAARERPQARSLADRCYAYLRDQFVDHRHGGIMWELDAGGRAVNAKKQAYAQAFAIYGLSEYFAATRIAGARDLALALFDLLETHFVDPAHGGYIEALAQDWSPLVDVRLSDLDANTAKSQNTHLHILEAYTALHTIAPSARVEEALYNCIRIFEQRLFNPSTKHIRLFLDLDWTDRSESISFGHDIEASWLLWRAGEALSQAETQRLYPLVIDLARTTLREGVDNQGALRSERSFSGEVDGRRVWWVQSEAIVGFLNAYEPTGDAAFYDAARAVWRFIQVHQIDRARGEWTWWSDLDLPNPDRTYKAGFWKCPYHNGRAMLEASARLKRLAAAQKQ